MKRLKKPGKKKPKKIKGFAKGFADLNFILGKIKDLRSGAAYQAAEGTRQSKANGAYDMAIGTDAEKAQVRLMIDTWESIANLALGIGAISRNAIFGSAPIRYMWRALRPAIDKFRVNEPGYASRFEEVSVAYDTWLTAQGPGYTSEVDQGLNAMFG